MSTTTSSSINRFTIDFFEGKIRGLKASFDKAAKGFGSEYEELIAKMEAHPSYELEVVKATKTKRTYDGMNTKFIKDYISTLSNAKEMMAEYDAVQKMAKNCGTSAYPMTKKWFLGKFATEDAPFDMDAAKEQITNYRLSQAEQAAVTVMSAENADTQASQSI